MICRSADRRHPVALANSGEGAIDETPYSAVARCTWADFLL